MSKVKKALKTFEEQADDSAKAKMEKLKVEQVKTIYESSDDEAEDRRRKRRSMSDPNIIASLQIKNATGWFDKGDGSKPAVPKKPPSLCVGSPPLSRSRKFDANRLEPLFDKKTDDHDDDDKDNMKSVKVNQKNSGKKGKPSPPAKPDKLDSKTDKSSAKTKENGKAKPKGGIFGRLRKKSESDTLEDTEGSKRKSSESAKEDEETDIAASRKTISKPETQSANKGQKPKGPPPARPTSPPPVRPTSPPPRPPSPLSKPKLENAKNVQPVYETIVPEDSDRITDVRKINDVETFDDDDDDTDDEPIADPEDFDDDFSDSEEELAMSHSTAHLHIKIQPITLPIEIEEEEKEFEDEAHKVAHELLVTEKKYVNRLFLVDQVFHFRLDNENRMHNWFSPDVVKDMFANIKSIYKFHSDFLLPQMEQRLQDWDNNPKIGDIMKSNAPFFRMYSEYVKNFDHAMELLNSWMVKVPEFAELVRTIQKDKACGSLSLPHHLLEPVQRIPRYELLMKEYLKNLAENSPDKKDTEEALILISTAAKSSNEAMGKLDKFKKMLELQSSVDGLKDMIVQGRELLKEGKIVKRSARKAESQSRYLFLFSDIILCCSVHVKIVNNARYHVRAKMDLQGMQVANVGDSDRIFRLSSRQKVIEFQASSDEEKTEWIEAITEAIAEYEKKYSTIQNEEDDLISRLGKRAPKWVRDDETSQCMRCASPFHPIKRRRHHCRACGLVVCHKCSNYKARLLYDDNKLNRVDAVCYNILQKERKLIKEDSKSSTDEQDSQDAEEKFEEEKTKVEEEEEINYSGHLHQSITDGLGRKQWSKRWVVISNMAMHFNRAKQDINPFLSVPLSCYKVHDITEEDGIERKNCFKIMYKKTCHYLSASNEAKKNEWMEMIKIYSKPSVTS
ncbi:FYVE, RhoGEF and PH domain-containing protein 2-like isoform X2 [Glandiceps talaboti]